MKKIIATILGLMLVVGAFTVPVFAADTETDPVVTEGGTAEGTEVPEVTDTTVPDTTDPEVTVETEEKAFTAELVDALTDGATWVKVGSVLAALLGALVAVSKATSNISNLIGGLKNMVEGKATKEETEKLVKSETDKIISATLTALDDTKKKQDELTAKYNEQTAILTLITLQLVKSPYARTEIMNLITTAKMQGKEAAEIVEVIEAEIKAAEDSEEKVPTPALDSILVSVTASDTDGVADGESGVALG